MNYSINNENLAVHINSLGAELMSIKYNNKECLWQGKKTWLKRSPVLFPVVGRCMNNVVTINDTDYPMPQHGFAKDCEFSLFCKSRNSITFRLDINNDVFYNCALEIQYIINDNILHTKYTVINKSNDIIYFNIGGHPGFRCPFNDDEKFEDYILKFDTVEKMLSRNVHPAGDIAINDFTVIPSKDGIIKLNRNLFKADAMIFEHLKSKYVSIISTKTNEEIKFDFSKFPYLAIWTLPTYDAKYVCIEPWHGMAYRLDENTDIKSKRGIITLKPNNRFDISWNVEFNLDNLNRR